MVLDLSRGRLCSSPVAGKTARHYRRLSWASARFALLSDLALLGLGSKLKFKEKLTGRLADVLSWIFLGFSALRRFEAEGRKPEDLPLVDWAVEHSLGHVQLAFDGILANFDVPVLGVLLRTVGRFWNRVNPLGSQPADSLGARVARTIQEPGAQRDRLTDGIYLPESLEHAAGRLERAFVLTTRARFLLERIQGEVRSGRLARGRPESLIGEAEADGILTAEQAALVRQAETARMEVLQVDAFDPNEVRGWLASTRQPERRDRISIAG
jgi:acyl-CoA dehydrogenase